jgi:catechol 2,3-dioxygenase-like lactoylglutathione lyase family enzyme
MATAPIQVKSLDHVTIVVRDLAATRQFYVEALGMREVSRPGFNFAGQWFQAGPTQIHTILEYAGSGPAGNGAGNNSRGHHFAFMVDDAEACYRRLIELGIATMSPPKHRPDGAVQVFVQDPDGHLVELCSAGRGVEG